MDDLFSDAVKAMLTDHCTPALVRAIEAGQPRAALWQAFEESGFADALVPESAGGSGLALADVYPVLELCGSFAVPVPLGETLLARGLLAYAGVSVPRGSVVFGTGQLGSDGRLHGAQVRCGTQADWVLVSCGGACRLLSAADAQVQVAGFCLDAQMSWPQEAWDRAHQVPVAHDLVTLQAALYAAQLAGALMAVFSRTLQYANDRQQFGKPIGKFQAIQHQLAVVAENVAATRMAAEIGCTAAGCLPVLLRAAAGKARASEAASLVAPLAHAIHGAIGVTAELDLQLFTRRIHEWRADFGSELHWNRELGHAFIADGRGALEFIRTSLIPANKEISA